MKIKLTMLSEEEQSHRWDLSLAWLEELFLADVQKQSVEAELYKPVAAMSLQVWVYRNEKEVFFRAKLGGQLQSMCVRCLENLPFPLDLSFEGLFIPNEQHSVEEPEDSFCYYHDGDSIDFTQPVRENVFLHLPFSPSCLTLEVPCIGTPLQAEDDMVEKTPDGQSIDPRWAALLNVKSSQPKK